FHAVKLINDAVDQVRRAESKNRPQLKYSRYLWLMNESRLSVEQSLSLEALCSMNLKTARAYRIRLAFQDMYNCPSQDWAELVLNRWYSWPIRSRLEPIKKVARTVKRHRDGILRWFDSKIANGASSRPSTASFRQRRLKRVAIAHCAISSRSPT